MTTPPALPASPLQPEPQEWRRWLGFRSLRARIFAVNIVAVIVLAIMLLYLDTVRSRLLIERSTELGRQAITIAGFAGDLPPAELAAAIERKGYPRGTRVRLYAPDGTLLADNWRRPETPRFEVEDPATQTWRRRSARWIDRALETVNGSGRPEAYREARHRQWPAVGGGGGGAGDGRRGDAGAAGGGRLFRAGGGGAGDGDRGGGADRFGAPT